MNYIKIYRNAQALSVSVRNFLSEDQLMHTFLDNFLQGWKCSAQIASHQVELRNEEKFTDKKSLSSSSLQTDYLNTNNSLRFVRNIRRKNNFQKKCTFCGGVNHSSEKCFKRIRQEKKKSRVAGDLDNKQKKRTPWKCFRCGYGDHLIAKFPKPL